MMTPSYILLYVADMTASRAFYDALLGLQPIEAAPTFSFYVLPNGLKLALWSRDGVIPAATPPGGFELGFPLGSDDEVDATAKDWTARGIELIQPPMAADFGRTFTAVDPDGHRLRVFHVAR
ncbi:VOC family protein [Rhizobium sp. TRM95796]|nr:VOC family protein [Rhizobium sp. TRM95796]